MADYIDIPKPGDPVRAGWAEDVAQLLRSQRLTAGPGLRVVATPSGTTIMLAPDPGDNVVDEPRAYELRWRLNQSTQVVELACYVGDPAAIYLRNGVAVQMRDSLDAAILPDADGWITIAGPTTTSNHYIIVSAHGCIYGTEAGARWDITASAVYPPASGGRAEHDQAVLVGRVVDGHIMQMHTGVISTSYTDAVPAIILGGSAATGYAIAIHGNGLAHPSTSSGYLYATEISAHSLHDLPAGSVVLAHRGSTGITGGPQ